MRLTDEELHMLENAWTEDDWNEACDAIKAARRGAYPPDWFPRILASGMLRRITARWRHEPQFLRIASLRRSDIA